MYDHLINSSLIFFQKCDTKLDDDLAKLTSEDCVAAAPFPSLGSADSSWEPFPEALKPQQPNILQPTRAEHRQLCECLSLACSEVKR